MIRIACPWCGPRDMTEFAYVGDATPVRPELGAERGHFAFAYLRDNPRGPHLELWHHVFGCRQHVEVRRDTVTHRVLETGAPGTLARPDDAPRAGTGDTA